MYLAGPIDDFDGMLSGRYADTMIHLFITHEQALDFCAHSSTKCVILDIGWPQECTVVESRIAHLDANRRSGEPATYEYRVWPHQSFEGAMQNG